jgi:hypothetical protein
MIKCRQGRELLSEARSLQAGGWASAGAFGTQRGGRSASPGPSAHARLGESVEKVKTAE